MNGACPVCAAPSGGGKVYQSKNLYGHLMLRHKTDTPQLPAMILKEQSELEGTVKINFESEPFKEPSSINKLKEKKQTMRELKPSKDLSKPMFIKPVLDPASKFKRSGFSLKTNLSERQLLVSKPIRIALESSEDDEQICHA